MYPKGKAGQEYALLMKKQALREAARKEKKQAKSGVESVKVRAIDGSIVTLNPNSVLKVEPPDVSENNPPR